MIVYARLPEAGKVKTRLADAVGHDSACEVYGAFIATITARVGGLRGMGLRIDYAPDTSEAREYFSQRHGDVAAQSPGDLGERMFNSFRSAFAAGFEKVCLIGTDIPDIPLIHIEKSFERLSAHDLVLGPSRDGGYCLIAMKEESRAVFENIAWSTTAVLEDTLRAAKDAGLATTLIPEWDDVDDAPGLERLRQRLEKSAGDAALDLLKQIIDKTDKRS